METTYCDDTIDHKQSARFANKDKNMTNTSKTLIATQQPHLTVSGQDGHVPVARILCVGQNYAAHAREMGSNPDRQPPFFFTKPAHGLIAATGSTPVTCPYPPRTADLHHEGELVVVIGKAGRDIPATHASEHIFGYAAGLDLTRRDMQAEAKKAGRPWAMSKGFDGSAILSPVTPISTSGLLSEGTLALSVNGEERQNGDLSDMIWSVDEIIAELSTYMTLVPGDLIFTGTPAGVSAIHPGDVITLTIAGLATDLTCSIV